MNNGYKIKQTPKDFIVKEFSNLKIKENGNFTYYTLIKNNYTTQRAVDVAAKLLKTNRKNIGYAGTKDKIAITHQTISVQGPTPCRNLDTKDIKLVYIGRGDERLSLGNLKGNAFIITLRDIEEKTISKLKYVTEIPNYFDEQRFSTSNLKIGLNILKKKFKDAVSLIDENSANEYLKNHKNDYVGAIKSLPLNIQRFFIGSVQSYIFNETINEYLTRNLGARSIKYSQGILIMLDSYSNIENLEIPLVGFGTEYENNHIESIVERKLRDLNLTKRDFITRSIPHLSSEGDLRPMLVNVENFRIGESQTDELNKGKKKIQVTFNLTKGAYATMVIRQLFLFDN